MGDKKSKSFKNEKKDKPSVSNDQLGENAAQGRLSKESSKSSK